MFGDILEKNEEIIRVIKPDKKRFMRGQWHICLFFLLPGWGQLFLVLFALFLWPVVVRIFKNNYENRFYAYTNKRILIRKGIIGTDYKSLEYRSITATIVQVGFLDKALKTNTGTIEFGSPASPIGGGGKNAPGNPYVFTAVKAPYDTLREIKEYMDSKNVI